MSTDNTEHVWYWYQRIHKDGTNYLGLINEDYDPPTTGGYNIDIYGWSHPVEVATDGDTLPFGAEFELGFMKGVASEILQQKTGRRNRDWDAEYKEAYMSANAARVNRSEQPIRVLPLDLRDDEC